MLRVLDIRQGTSVDGEGLRTAIYFAGCRHACPGCQNPDSWSFDAGTPMTVDDIMAVVREADFNVTFTGGDPLFSIDELIPLAKAIKAEGYNIWCYTGFTLEAIKESKTLSEILRHIDVLVDGPYIESLRDTSLTFRGSSNQRIIHIANQIAT